LVELERVARARPRLLPGEQPRGRGRAPAANGCGRFC